MAPAALIAYVDYMVVLARKGQFETYLCQDCLAEKNFSLNYLPTDERQTDTAFCEGCHVCKPVSNPYINQYIIDRYAAFTYPRRQECNSDTYLIRDVFAGGQLRVRCSRTAHYSAMPAHEGMTADQIYQYEYHKAMVQFLRSGPGLFTPPHARLFNETYQAVLGPELMPLSERILFPRENSGRESSPRSAEILIDREASASGNTLGNRLVRKYLSLRNKVLKFDLIRLLKE